LRPGQALPTGRALFDAALAGGAQALGCGPASGGASGLTVGQPADLFTLDPAHAALVGRSGDALLDSWILAHATARSIASGATAAVSSAPAGTIARDAIEARYGAALRRLAA
jgi:cytosine/adenosine deaminase-related metal-dependent hydrolase